MISSAVATSLAADPKALGDLRARAAADPQGALKEAAKQFETLFMDMMLKSMRSTTSGESMFDSEATRMFTGLLDQEFSRKLGEQGGLGLADLLVKQLSQLAPKAPEESGETVKK